MVRRSRVENARGTRDLDFLSRGRTLAYTPKRMHQLREIGQGQGFIDSILARHPATRHVGGAEQDVQQRELPRKVLVARGEFLTVMPVMELWRCDKPTQWPKADADIGMDEDRLPLEKHRKNHNRCVRKAQCKNRDQ